MIANAKTLRQSEVSLQRKSNGMEASLLPRKNYASAISDRLNVDPIEQGGEKFIASRKTLMMVLRAGW